MRDVMSWCFLVTLIEYSGYHIRVAEWDGQRTEQVWWTQSDYKWNNRPSISRVQKEISRISEITEQISSAYG